ncbi:hypothetical protein [Mycoplasma sp. P36-A1]|uniref:hypothetical protein n=1 Tax=Mycoplasma sp. P36-A1 TaxID=3252900 RepID=UPI003C3049ED
MSFEVIDKEDYKAVALKQIYLDLFSNNIKELENLKAGAITREVFDKLFEIISTKEEFMEDILENPYLIKEEDDLLLWLEKDIPKLQDLDNLESNEFFKAIENWIVAININLEKEYNKECNVKYLDIIDINLKIRDSLVLGKGKYEVDSSIVKEIYKYKAALILKNKRFS